MKNNYNKSIITLLTGLHRQYSNKPLSVHLYGALAEYKGEFWGLSDKELFRCLEVYAENLPLTEDAEDIAQIYEDAMNLSLESFDEEEDY